MNQNNYIIDLFCGAGGTTTGIEISQTNNIVVACVNHDDIAISSHLANHSKCKHFTEDIRNFKVVLKLKKIVDRLRKKEPNCKISIWASLECTNFSIAKGGLPRDEDSRTLANSLFMYLDNLYPDFLFIENVKEFMSWGALDENGKPISKLKGLDYLQWVDRIKQRGFNFEHQILNCADFNCYTSRVRYFGMFAKIGLPIVFPIANNKSQRKPVREVLDLNNKGADLFSKKRSDNTIKRILAGCKVQLGKSNFLTSYYGNGKSHSIDTSCNTLTTHERYAFHYIHYDYSNLTTSSIEDPAGTFTKVPKHNLMTLEWLTDTQYNRTAKSIDEPCFTIIARLDKKPIYLLQAERGYSIDFIKNDDSEAVKELKEFMILNFIKSISIRMLTIDEMLAIQGFPANYILNGTKANRTKFIGNSVPPPFVSEWMKTISIALENHIKAA